MAERWLAIDTSGDQASAAVLRQGGEVIEEIVAGNRRHARELVPAIQRVLAQAGLSPDRLAGILVSDGPGSFTGLRIGATVAKALAHVNGLPLRSASALSLMARDGWRSSAAATSAGCDLRILATADALRGEVYAALYDVGPRRIAQLRGPQVVTPEALDAWPAADMRLSSAPQASTLLDLLDVEGGTVLVHDLLGWEPEYGRPAEAQARWEALHGRQLPDSPGSTR